jgi:nitrite reductase/ring-hydroxylating ferredoxin subunit
VRAEPPAEQDEAIAQDDHTDADAWDAGFHGAAFALSTGKCQAAEPGHDSILARTTRRRHWIVLW